MDKNKSIMKTDMNSGRSNPKDIMASKELKNEQRVTEGKRKLDALEESGREPFKKERLQAAAGDADANAKPSTEVPKEADLDQTDLLKSALKDEGQSQREIMMTCAKKLVEKNHILRSDFEKNYAKMREQLQTKFETAFHLLDELAAQTYSFSDDNVSEILGVLNKQNNDISKIESELNNFAQTIEGFFNRPSQ